MWELGGDWKLFEHPSPLIFNTYACYLGPNHLFIIKDDPPFFNYKIPVQFPSLI